MSVDPDPYSNGQLYFWGTRFLICVIILLIYLFIWRPLRIAATQQVVYSQIQYFEDNQTNYSSSLETGSLIVDYNYGQQSKQLYYRPEFGFFFLVSLMVLLFVTQQKRYYIILAGLHLVASLLTFPFLMVGAIGMPAGYVATDIISGYLTPALTLALPPLVVTGIIDE